MKRETEIPSFSESVADIPDHACSCIGGNKNYYAAGAIDEDFVADKLDRLVRFFEIVGRCPNSVQLNSRTRAKVCEKGSLLRA